MTETPPDAGLLWGQLVTQTAKFWVSSFQAAESFAGTIIEWSYDEVDVPGVNYQTVMLPVAADCRVTCSELREFGGTGLIPATRLKVDPEALAASRDEQEVTIKVQVEATTVSGDYEGAVLDAVTNAVLAPVRILIIGPGP